MREDTQMGWIRRTAVAAGGVSVLMLGAAPVEAQDTALEPAFIAQSDPAPKNSPAEEPEDPNAKQVEKATEIKYVPVLRGAPRRRVGAAARGGPTASPPIPLAPEHVAFTTSATPTLFWFLETPPPAETAIVFTLTNESSFEPLVESELPKLEHAGVQRIDLAQLGVELEPDIEYAWSITIVRDPDARSHDLVGIGHLSRVATPGAPDATSATALAASGLWYDALTAARHTEDASQSWNALLRQADLESAIASPN